MPSRPGRHTGRPKRKPGGIPTVARKTRLVQARGSLSLISSLTCSGLSFIHAFIFWFSHAWHFMLVTAWWMHEDTACRLDVSRWIQKYPYIFSYICTCTRWDKSWFVGINTEYILVLLFINYCIISHSNNC